MKYIKIPTNINSGKMKRKKIISCFVKLSFFEKENYSFLTLVSSNFTDGMGLLILF